ncbi:hypothetical protein RFI_32807 [Reticulomyxa filosa]|uniref:Histone RNA hairpin-binding protein RNA-binding domain-containing protein n=1 Tax=Reticulomyxa filosa TaxID=46433 RepID=X6LT80_RETFI|nr:hypothetical protein RFI_32807 [Reticulomyxa filosa]|eukprot:ETO04591.1 hypothetical protein RFI_32807 [Reticulomyxa filosa]
MESNHVQGDNSFVKKKEQPNVNSNKMQRVDKRPHESDKNTAKTWANKLFSKGHSKSNDKWEKAIYVEKKSKSQSDECPPHQKSKLEEELTEHQIYSRQKLIAMGKNTTGYVKAQRHYQRDPATPEPTSKISKRRWQGKLCKWRRQLHEYDLTEVDEARLKETRRLIEREFPMLQELDAVTTNHHNATDIAVSSEVDQDQSLTEHDHKTIAQTDVISEIQ